MIWSLRPPLGAWTASALVIFPPATVIRTCTGPYCVCATSPVTVWALPEPCEAPAEALALSSADWRDFL